VTVQIQSYSNADNNENDKSKQFVALLNH